MFDINNIQIFYCIKHKGRIANYMWNGNTYCEECMFPKWRVQV